MPLFGFAFSEKALASLKDIPIKFRRQIVAKAETLLADPTPPGSKKLQNVKEDDAAVHRIRIGRLSHPLRCPRKPEPNRGARRWA